MAAPVESCFLPLGHVPEIVHVAPAADAELGSILIPQIENGDVIPLSGNHAIIADFDNIRLLDEGLEERYQLFSEAFLGSAATEGLFGDSFQGLDVEQQKIVQDSIFAGQIAEEFFTRNFANGIKDPSKVNVWRALHGWTTHDRQNPDTPMSRKLSESADLGMCSEVAIFAKEVGKRVGTDLPYATGYVSDFAIRKKEYHSFLITLSGDIIADSAQLMNGPQEQEPHGLYIPDEETFFEELQLGAYYMGLDRTLRHYSAMQPRE